MTGTGWRTELADLLRSRRAEIERSALGLPPGARRGTHGLRREEVATMAGVSITWYTWLEQARDVNPSRQVLDAIAGALTLTPAEHAYLLGLAGYAAAPAGADSPAPAATHIQHLLDALAGSPAFAIGPDWSIRAWNDAYRALYPRVATVPSQDRNLLWAVFADPFVRDLLPDWEVTSRRFLAEFRAEAGPRLGQAECTRLVERLRARSPEFDDGWTRHHVEGFTSRERRFQTAEGLLSFEHHRLAAADQRDLFVVVYTPSDADTVRRLAALSEQRAG